MPRGKYVNHKGRSRHFTSPEELEQARKAEEAKKKWRQTHDSDEEEEAAESASAESGSEEESSDEDAGEKGAHALIEIENPNRVHKKAVQKVSALNIETASATSSGGSKSGNGPKPELSRREREEIDKQKAQAAYQKLHSQGKTEQAKADLARLAIIKQQRQEAADRREKERKEKEAKKA